VILVAAIWGDRFVLNGIETLTGLRFQPGGSKVYVFLLVLAIQIALFAAALIYIQRHFLPRCQSCRKALGRMDQGIAIATKNCPHCGAQIISIT
jgi:hypothetical protein